MAHRGGDVVAEYVLTADYFHQVVARDEKGVATRTVRRFRGDALSDLEEADVPRLLAAGAIREVTDEPEPEDEDEQPTEPPVPDEPQPAPERARRVEAPRRTALKDEWVEYAVTKGFDRADAEAMNKDDLIAALS